RGEGIRQHYLSDDACHRFKALSHSALITSQIASLSAGLMINGSCVTSEATLIKNDHKTL
ncbi:hypothetical protein, partial [Enterobacter hormaechei]|uniref:hypothetical protein n=1 Tax=Enterobacter hormaechei TaxID=158836 RepID=UPI00203C85B7